MAIGVLIDLILAVAVLGIAAIMFPIIKRYNEALARLIVKGFNSSAIDSKSSKGEKE